MSDTAEEVNNLMKHMKSKAQLINLYEALGNSQSIYTRHYVDKLTLKIKQHRRGRRNSAETFTKDFNWVGNNIAGARSKWVSVRRWIKMKTPSILSLQETKFQVTGKHNLYGYISYEHLRTKKTSGGGLYMAFLTELSPAL